MSGLVDDGCFPVLPPQMGAVDRIALDRRADDGRTGIYSCIHNAPIHSYLKQVRSPVGRSSIARTTMVMVRFQFSIPVAVAVWESSTIYSRIQLQSASALC